MYYSDEIIEEVRSRNDILDIVGSYVSLKRKGGSYFGLCPFHNEKTGSFSVSQPKQMYYCFGCGAGGNVISFVMQYENLSFQEAVQMLAKRAGISLPETEAGPKERAEHSLREQLLEIHKVTATHFYKLLHTEEGRRGYSYFTGRKLTGETIRRFGLGYSSKRPGELYRFLREKGYSDAVLKESGLVTIEEKGSRDKFWNRVMFPILDVNNRVIGFGGRVLGDGEPKYLNSPETKIFDKSRNLYGLNYAKSSRKDHFLLCEGYMDVISLHQAGFTNAVASLGTALTSQHCVLLKKYVKQVVLTYDSDGAGIKAALRAIPLLRSAGIEAKVLSMKPYKDPDEFIKNLGAEAYSRRIEEARNAFLWQIDQLSLGFNMDDPADKTAFYRAAAAELLVFEDSYERENYIAAVAREHLIPPEELRRMVNTLGMQKSGSIRPRDPEIEPRPVRTKNNRSVLKNDAVNQSQRILLSSVAEDPGLYPSVRRWLKPDDFTDPFYREIAEKLFSGLDTGSFSAASILSAYADDEERSRLAAAVFHTAPGTELSPEERSKALSDCIRNIRTESLNQRARNAVDANELQRILKEKTELKRISLEVQK